MVASLRESPPVALAVIRVLGLAAQEPRLRHDTPLAGLGVDSLAILCIGDLLASDGWHLDPAEARSARTLGDLATCCRPVGAA